MKICILFNIVSAALFAQAPPPVAPDTVVATIDGKNVTLGELRTMLETYPPIVMQSFQRDPQQALRDLFTVRYTGSEGAKLKLGEESPWKEQIEIGRMQVLSAAMINHERNHYPVSDESIDAYYKHNQARYEQAQIKIIKIAFKAAASKPQSVEEAARQALESAHAASDRSEADARKLAAELVKKLRAGGDFVKFVAQYSDDVESKESGGDFGVVKRTSPYAEDFKKAVFVLEPGEVSDPIPSGSSLYIVRVEKKTVQPLDNVREQIIGDIKDAHLSEYLSGMQKRFTPVIVRPDVLVQMNANMRPPSK